MAWQSSSDERASTASQTKISAEVLVGNAIEALSSGDDCHAMLDALPVPVYTTDTTGLVTYWNRACSEFAGREPQLGQDRWCVTWRIHTTAGERLPHDRCPMAIAIKEQRAVRDEVAIAERPDGTRRAFKPYPTPLFDDNGTLVGAVNLLIDVSDEQAGALGEQAERCHRLAGAIDDLKATQILQRMAEGYQRNARALIGG